jgi:hypothetical protein
VTPGPVALDQVVAILERLAIPYMVTGSIASSVHGEPRMTNDADIVVDLDVASVEALLRSVTAQGLYVGEDTARQAVRQRRQFNVIDATNGFKIDLIVLKDRPFSREEFSRRRKASLTATLSAAVASPEDSILSKLEWSRKAGESSVQLSDAAGVARVTGARLDVAYVERWAAELDVLDLWRRVALSRA